MKICRHNFDGLGHCDIGGGADYCIEGPCVHEDLVEFAPMQPDRWEGHADPIGALGCLPFCPVCGSRRMQWDPETGITTCGDCGYRNTEQAHKNLAKRVRNGEVTREGMMISDEALKKLQEQIAAWPMAQRFTVQRLIESYLSDRQALRAYQSTGLTPEETLPKEKADKIALKLMRLAELEGFAPYDRLRELAEADKAGRVVVLPCKVGDTVWVTGRDNVPREMKLEAPDIRTVCTDEDNLCMSTCNRKPDGFCAYRLRNDGADIGKTVFLTREEAERALEAKRNGAL